MRASRKAPLKKARLKKKKGASGEKRLLARAYDLHRQGQIARAREAYEQFLAKRPGHAEALANLGLLHHSQGQVQEAVDCYRQALEKDPRLSHFYYHLGNGLRQLGSPVEAMAAYEQGLSHHATAPELLFGLGLAQVECGNEAGARHCFEQILAQDSTASPASYQLGLLYFADEEYDRAVACFQAVMDQESDNVDALFNLALCHKALGRWQEALASLEQAVRLAPDDSDILYNIGVLYREGGELDAAEKTFLQVLERQPAMGICLTDLAILYHLQERFGEAAAMYERALACGYRPDSARHMLAAIAGETTPATPLEHVRDLFNNYAHTFDASLVQELGYQVPVQLAESFRKLRGHSPLAAGIDLGCGTGLSGLAFADLLDHFIGVDLSENMLQRAAAKEIYREVHCADILDFLAGCRAAYDLALATDVFVYVGGLEAFFQGVVKALKPAGYFLFSVESCSQGYCLRQSGRYAHAPEYIAGLAQAHDFAIVHRQQTGIRKERGVWIDGEIYILQYLPAAGL